MTSPTAPMAWVDGELMPLSAATVSVLDQGFRTGEGVFETLRAYNGHPFRLHAHLDRAAAGAARLGFDVPDQASLYAAVEATIHANAGLASDLAVRLTVTPGPLDPDAAWPSAPIGTPTVVVTAHALNVSEDRYRQGVTAVTVPWPRAMADVKATSHLVASLARRRAHAAGADEALLVDGSEVLEGAGSNVVAVHDGVVRTPPADGRILAGVTRGTVLNLAAQLGIPCAEERLAVADLLEADEACLMASTTEVTALTRVDGTVIGAGRPGELTQRLHAAYRQAVHDDGQPGVEMDVNQY